jgi:DHA2 family multidrug resistance protein
MSAPSPEAERVSYKWKVMISVIFGIFMATLDTTAMNVAFPVLREQFGATFHAAQWVVSIYVLAVGITTPVAGFAADRYGIKRVYTTGLAVFVIGSLLAGSAPTLGVLIAARALKGIGAGLALPCGLALLFRGFTKEELGFALGVFGVALLFAPALGPVLAGVLIDHGHWRWIFFINVPIGVLGIVLSTRFLREQRSATPPTWDGWGFVLAALGFGLALYATSLVTERGWGDLAVAGSFTVGGLALIAFALVELYRAPDPLFDLRLFRGRTFAIATIVGYVTVVAFFGAEFLLPIYLQALRGRTALETGLILLPLALGAGITMPIAGKLYDWIGPRILVVSGFALLLYNTWSLAHLSADTPIGFVVFITGVRGFALGLTVQTPFTAAMAVVPHDAVPRASSLVTATRNLTQAVGVALLATLLGSALATGARTADRASLMRDPGATCAARGEASLECGAYLSGLSRAYELTFALSLVALILGAFLPGWPGVAHTAETLTAREAKRREIPNGAA